MTNQEYRSALDAALRELETLIILEEKLRDRMLALRKTINVLSTLCEGDGADWADQASEHVLKVIHSTISDDILKVVTASLLPLTTTEIREELNKLGGSLAEQKNPLATINAVLNRLEDQGKVKQTLKGDRRAWSPTMVPLSNLVGPKHFDFDRLYKAIEGLKDAKRDPVGDLWEAAPSKPSDPLEPDGGIGRRLMQATKKK